MDRPATDIAALLQAGGTIYLLGREDPYASASPLMTAVAEYTLDVALQLANRSPWGRLCPPMLTVLDEPSTAPLPTLRTRMANERALGLSFVWAAQTRRQLAAVFGEQEARALFGLTNVLIMFGGSKDVAFNKEVSHLTGTIRVPRSTWQSGRMGGRSVAGEDIPVLRPEHIRELPERQALVIAENGRPIIARLTRCIDGPPGRRLLAEQHLARTQPRTSPRRRSPQRPREPIGFPSTAHDTWAWHPQTGPTHDQPPRRPRGDGALSSGVLADRDRMKLAYLELWAEECQNDSDRPLPVRQAEGFPRPWDPANCHDLDLRREVWHWLDQVVDWLNTEYAWDVASLIPGCWYRHPHLVHELGTLADQRRRAGLAFTSTPLEEWHRYTLPMFIDRIRERAKSYCEETHKDPPGRASYPALQQPRSHQRTTGLVRQRHPTPQARPRPRPRQQRAPAATRPGYRPRHREYS